MRIMAVAGRSEDFPHLEVDELLLSSSDLTRRIFRKRTQSGREVKVTLPRHTILRPGDVLLVDVATMVVVRVQPEWLLAIRPTGFAQIAEIGHQLGNRHIPIQIDDAELLVQYLPVLEQLCVTLQVQHEKVYRAVNKPFLHIFAPHIH